LIFVSIWPHGINEEHNSGVGVKLVYSVEGLIFESCGSDFIMNWNRTSIKNGFNTILYWVTYRSACGVGCAYQHGGHGFKSCAMNGNIFVS